MADYVMTIDSDVEDSPELAINPAKDEALNPDFTFDLSGDPYTDFLDDPPSPRTTMSEKAPDRYVPLCLFAQSLNVGFPRNPYL